MNPLFVEVGALDLGRESRIAGLPGGAKLPAGEQRRPGAQRDHGDDHHKGNGGQLKGHQVRTTVEDLINGYLRFR